MNILRFTDVSRVLYAITEKQQDFQRNYAMPGLTTHN